MICISLFLVFITVVYFTEYFWHFMNEYLHWWYTLVCLIILIPLLISAFFVIGWLTGDSKATRKLLYWATVLALTSVIILCIWNVTYLLGLYKFEDYYYGSGDIDSHHYSKINKKFYIVIDIFKSIIIMGVLLCFRGYTDTYEEINRGCRDIQPDRSDPRYHKDDKKEESEKPKSEKPKSEKPAEDAPAE
jgi:hypothetical protein